MADYGGQFSSPALSATVLNTGVNGIPGRAVLIICTGTGTTTVTMSDGTTIALTIQAATIYQFNWSVLKVTTGTATATYYNLY